MLGKAAVVGPARPRVPDEVLLVLVVRAAHELAHRLLRVAALADATATLLDAIGPAKRRKVETDLFREAQSPGDLALRLGSIELLGRAGGPGTALELQKQFVTQGLVPSTFTTAEYSALIREDYNKWSKLIKDANIRPN